MPAKPNKMLIVCHADGSVEHTHRPDILHPFGEADIQINRMTDIRFDPGSKRWRIVFLLGATAAGQRLAGYACTQALTDALAPLRLVPAGDPVATYRHGIGRKIVGLLSDGPAQTFATYEDAVAHEVFIVDAMRRCDVTFNTEASSN